MADAKIDLLAPVDLLDDDLNDEQQEEYEDIPEKDIVFDAKTSAYVKTMLREVELYIKNFFRDKEMWCGGPVPVKSIINDKYIDLVLTISLIDAIDVIHRVWSLPINATADIAKKKSHERSMHIVRTQKLCKDAGIPQEWSGGITMMYYEFCEGFKFP